MTPEEIQALYDEWVQSGETQREFIRHKQLNRSIFNNNYTIINTGSRGKKRHQPESLRLLPVRVFSQPQEELPVPTDLCLQFNGGASLRFSVGTSIEYLSDLMSALQSRRAC